MTDPADGERQMRPVPPQNLTMRSGAATGADSSSSPTDMDCAPPYNMKQMEIPHSKRREWRCEVFKVHSRPLNLVSRYGVKPGLTSRQLLGLRSGQHTIPSCATTRQEHQIRLRRSEVEPGYLLCKLPGDVTAPEFGVCPHTRTIHGVGSPTAQRRASDDDANARAKAFSAAIRDGTGSAVGDADGAPGWGRFQSTRFTDANGSSTPKNREAYARARAPSGCHPEDRRTSHAEAKAAAERAAAERAAAAVALRRGMEAVRVAV